jgi:hypothetical protein
MGSHSSASVPHDCAKPVTCPVLSFPASAQSLCRNWCYSKCGPQSGSIKVAGAGGTGTSLGLPQGGGWGSRDCPYRSSGHTIKGRQFPGRVGGRGRLSRTWGSGSSQPCSWVAGNGAPGSPGDQILPKGNIGAISHPRTAGTSDTSQAA